MVLDWCLRVLWEIRLGSVAVLLLSGCTVMDAGGQKNMPLADGAAATAPTPVATVTMEVRPVGKKPEMAQTQVNRGATVQQVLEQTKLVQRFRRMKIEVLRVAGDQRAKLDVKYDHTKAQVNPLYDYAIYPGDHLIVAEDPATSLDDMLKSLTSPRREKSDSRPVFRIAT